MTQVDFNEFVMLILRTFAQCLADYTPVDTSNITNEKMYFYINLTSRSQCMKLEKALKRYNFGFEHTEYSATDHCYKIYSNYFDEADLSETDLLRLKAKISNRLAQQHLAVYDAFGLV